METVMLFSFTGPDIKVTIEAYFNEAGGLVVDGYDIGKSVEDYFGDSDYEYMLTVPQPEVAKLYALFRCLPTSLPRCFATFNRNSIPITATPTSRASWKRTRCIMNPFHGIEC